MRSVVTKHRRIRPGAVPVHVLLTARPPSPAHTHRSRPSGTWSNVGKIVGMGMSVAVLCGAMVTANTISERHRSTATAPERVTGVQALSLDTPGSTPAGGPGHPRIVSAAPTGPPVTATGDTQTSTPRVTPPPAGSSAAAPTSSTPPSTQGGHTRTSTYSAERPAAEHRAAQLRLVRKFYGELPTADRGALATLAPGLLDGTVDDVLGGGPLRAWDSVREVTVEALDSSAPSEVRATVLVRRADGAVLRLRQLLTLTDSAHPVIDRIELLSAQSR